jgi:hypothetical protein
MGLTTLLPLRRKACCGFLSHLKSIAPAGFEPANLGSNGKHVLFDFAIRTAILRRLLT